MFHALCQRDNRIFLKFFPAGGGGREALVKKITLVKAGAVCYHYHDILPMMWGRKQKDKENFIMKVLVINAGSSSLKYQLMDPETGKVFAKGLCERIGLDGKFTYKPQVEGKETIKAADVAMPTHSEAIQTVLNALVDPQNLSLIHI